MKTMAMMQVMTDTKTATIWVVMQDSKLIAEITWMAWVCGDCGGRLNGGYGG